MVLEGLEKEEEEEEEEKGVGMGWLLRVVEGRRVMSLLQVEGMMKLWG